MPLYELDGVRVETPGEGRYWVAPSAVLIGKVDHRGGCQRLVRQRAARRQRADPHRRALERAGRLRAAHRPGLSAEVGPDCTIGHMVMLHGCTIGRGSLIGIGSIILNGAKIGEECLIGANTLIAEGKAIPPRSMVLGSPGKIIRQLSDEDAQRFGGAAGRYVEELETVRGRDETAGG